MSVSNTLNIGWSDGSSTTSFTDQVALNGNIQIVSNETIAGNSTTTVNIAFTKANLQGIVIDTDQTLTLKTNSSGASSDTITVTAGCPYIWYVNCGFTNPFAGNVTTTFWVNGNTEDANLRVRILTT